jgi:transformation/transcription domain-associated protein
LFFQVWNILGERQRETLAAELVPFVCSGAHVLQKDCHPSALNTFVEAMSLCQPAVTVKPAILKYLVQIYLIYQKN